MLNSERARRNLAPISPLSRLAESQFVPLPALAPLLSAVSRKWMFRNVVLRPRADPSENCSAPDRGRVSGFGALAWSPAALGDPLLELSPLETPGSGWTGWFTRGSCCCDRAGSAHNTTITRNRARTSCFL